MEQHELEQVYVYMTEVQMTNALVHILVANPEAFREGAAYALEQSAVTARYQAGQPLDLWSFVQGRTMRRALLGED